MMSGSADNDAHNIADNIADNSDDEDQEDDPPLINQLDERVLSAVRRSPNKTIRPARLASELGISFDDANAELCGLLSAVGGGEGGAYFTFEKKKEDDGSSVCIPPVMVFHFPADFEKRAKSFRRKQNLRNVLYSSFEAILKVLKVVVAFGMILSLVVLSIAVLVAIIGAIIALSSQQNNQNNAHRTALMRKMRSILMMLREVLWMYAMFGGGFGQSNNHPFFQEVSMYISVFLSCCFRSPLHPMFWFRMSRMSARRRRRRTGPSNWGGNYHPFRNTTEDSNAYTVVPGTWSDDIREDNVDRQQHDTDSNYRGLLSILVEYLFGPTPFSPGPSDREKWTLRAIVIASRPNGTLSVKDLVPYVDQPPTSLTDDVSIMAASTLTIVTHFNGIPAVTGQDETGTKELHFRFPELLAEAEDGIPFSSKVMSAAMDMGGDSSSSPWSLLFASPSQHSPETSSSDQSEIPPYLLEQKHVLTKLQPKQFITCAMLGCINYVGIQWLLRRALPLLSDASGTFGKSSMGVVIFTLCQGLLSILVFYAKLFLVFPLLRLLVICILNKLIDKRNVRRSSFVSAPEAENCDTE